MDEYGQMDPTDIDGKIPDRRKEHLDIRTSDQFGVHTSSILKECTTEQAFRAVKFGFSSVVRII